MGKQILLNAVKGCCPAFAAHFANLGPYNIFNHQYKAPGIIVINDEQSYPDN